MLMLKSLFLFGIPTLIWGSTWLVITGQLGRAPIETSVFYRFVIAAACGFALCGWKKESLRFAKKDHLVLAGQGLFMFCLNYILTYYSEQYVTSGIVALLFTFLLYFNMLGQWVFFRVIPDRKIVFAGICGALGLALIFRADIHWTGTTGWGIFLGVVATFCASLGNQFASLYKVRSISIFPGSTLAMTYGACWSGLLSLFFGNSFSIPLEKSYLLGLFYLAIPGTLVAFNFYLRLVRDYGATRASYTSVVIPLFALILSGLFEGLTFTLSFFFGILLIGTGQLIVLSPKTKAQPS